MRDRERAVGTAATKSSTDLGRVAEEQREEIERLTDDAKTRDAEIERLTRDVKERDAEIERLAGEAETRMPRSTG